MSPLRGTLKNLETALDTGTFTPIVGAACSSLEDDDEPRRGLNAHVQKRAAAIARLLDIDERRYLDEIIDIPSDEEIDGPETEETLNKLAPEILNFYVALVRLDRAAVRLFQKGAEGYRRQDGKRGEFLWKRRPSVKGVPSVSLPRRLDDWQVPFPGGDLLEDFERLLDKTIQTASVIEKSASASEWDARGLGAVGIRSQLQHFRKLKFGQNFSPVAPMRLTDLVWLGNLLWHVLKFEYPCYPTSAELAFQLALFAPDQWEHYTLESPQLAQAAQAISGPSRWLTKWFTHYSHRPGRSHFYDTLAHWLQQNYAIYDAPSSSWPLPVVFTTNYDMEIETALDALRKPYHVVLPLTYKRVETTKPDGAVVHSDAIWVVKTVSFPGINGEPFTWHYGGDTVEAAQSNKETGEWSPDKEKIRGPIVVKLHGSPLDRLPPVSIELPSKFFHGRGRSVAFEHRIVLSEADYLEDLRRGLPQWLRTTLQSSSRWLFFLGHSISDWNIRIRLADHVQWAAQTENKPLEPAARRRGDATHATHPATAPSPDMSKSAATRFAVNLNSKLFDLAFMDPLHIAYIPVELQAVRSTVHAWLRRNN